ncbi:MAG TPA: ATP-binding protein [Acidimicrobiales bacterium]|nr:ATP-binding protein [Acidimicrobiales bacterium]
MGQVRAARRFIEGAVRSWGFDPTVAAMIVGELATNAVVHGRTAFSVSLSDAHGNLRVEVADQNPRVPSATAQSPEARSGRGLHIVECLSVAWGVDPIPHEGKVVWAEFEAVAPY